MLLPRRLAGPLLGEPAPAEKPADSCAMFGAVLCGVGCVAILGFAVLLAYQLAVNYPHTHTISTGAPSPAPADALL